MNFPYPVLRHFGPSPATALLKCYSAAKLNMTEVRLLCEPIHTPHDSRQGGSVARSHRGRENLDPLRGGPGYLARAYLTQALLFRANLSGAEPHGASLFGAALMDTDRTGADLTGCVIHSVSAWRLKLERTNSTIWSSHGGASPPSPSTTSTSASGDFRNGPPSLPLLNYLLCEVCHTEILKRMAQSTIEA